MEHREENGPSCVDFNRRRGCRTGAHAVQGVAQEAPNGCCQHEGVASFPATSWRFRSSVAASGAATCALLPYTETFEPGADATIWQAVITFVLDLIAVFFDLIHLFWDFTGGL